VGMGFTKGEAWRYAMIVPGVLMLLVAFLYHRFTMDTPAGNFDSVKPAQANSRSTDWSILKDWRIWALSLSYAMCFGMEITFDNVAALHFTDTFGLSQSQAGFWAGIFGFMNLFARAVGGMLSDKTGRRFGMQGKGLFLAVVLLFEGAGLLLFAHAGSLPLAIASMLGFALFLKMANGATYGIVPFVNKDNVGLISGIVGAGGNVGGMLFGFLFRSASLSYAQAFVYIGYVVLAASAIVFMTRFSKKKPATSPLPEVSLA
jgi:MFS transporter, NNP family, nitrate/nitrite transporter